jgi:transcriptional regulator with XRE-family HTH domain
MNVGKNIRMLRQRSGLTQEALAERLGVSFQAISKWETEANTPDISLLPQIAEIFAVSIDALFSASLTEHDIRYEQIKDDDVIRVIQMRGTRVLKIDRAFSPDAPPIEIAFPVNCNERSQYFKVEVYGHVTSSSSINGDVVCHGALTCGDINGNVQCRGNIDAHSIHSFGDIRCGDINGCYQLQCKNLTTAGEVNAVHLNHEQNSRDK